MGWPKFQQPMHVEAITLPDMGECDVDARACAFHYTGQVTLRFYRWGGCAFHVTLHPDGNIRFRRPYHQAPGRYAGNVTKADKAAMTAVLLEKAVSAKEQMQHEYAKYEPEPGGFRA